MVVDSDGPGERSYYTDIMAKAKFLYFSVQVNLAINVSISALTLK